MTLVRQALFRYTLYDAISAYIHEKVNGSNTFQSVSEYLIFETYTSVSSSCVPVNKN